MNNDDLETADISTRVHNTRPHQDKIYAPIGRRGEAHGSGDDHSPIGDQDHAPKKRSNKSRKQRKGVPEEVNLTPEPVEESALERAERVFDKLSKKVSFVFERDDQARVIMGLLVKLQQQYALDDAVLDGVFRWGLLQLVLTNSEKIFKFGYLVEEVLNSIMPVVRVPSLKAKVNVCLVKSGALIFCMTAIRLFHKNNGNIRVQSVELLTAVLDFVAASQAHPTSVSSKIRKFVSKNYVIHHLLLHGAASSLPSLLSLFVQTSSDISIQRTLRCLTFVLTETPTSMSVTVAMNNRWGMLRDLLHCIRTMSPDVKVRAAVLLTGLIASSAVVAEKLVEMQAWDDLSTALTNPDLDFTDMPAAWLERSMDTMKLMQTRNISKKVVIPQKSLSERFTYISFDDNGHGLDGDEASDYDHISRDHDLDASTLADSDSDNRRLSELPNDFWPQTSPLVMRDEVDLSRIDDMKTRLKTSPFGDPSLIFAQNDRFREASKVTQQKLRRGESRLLKNPRPDKVLRSTQRKKVYPSQLRYEQKKREEAEAEAAVRRQQRQARRKQCTPDSGPVEVPADTIQSKEVAQQLFSSRPSSAAKESGQRPDGSPVKDTTSSALEHLSYAERLQVMILHCQDNYDKSADDS